MNRVTFLVGNIGSGKTYYSNSLEGTPVILCKDELREFFGDTINIDYLWDETLEEIIHDMTMDALEGLLHIGVREIFIDETNMSKTSRKPLLLLAKKYDYQTKAIIFEDEGMETHVNRRMSNPRGFNRGYWERVYKGKQGKYQPPTEEEFDVIENYTWREEN